MKWLVRIVVIAAAAALLVAAAEFAVRLVVSHSIASSIRSELQLDESDPVEVDLGGSALLHALQGGVGDVDIEVPDLQLLDGVRLDASGHADFSPFDPASGEIRGATASLSAAPDQLDALIALATQGFADTGEVKGGDIVVGRTLEFFGQSVPVTARLGLDIEGGDLVIEPKALDAAGFDLDVESLSELAPDLVAPVAGEHTVCVRDQLPAGITLTGITLADDGSVRIDAAVDPAILSDQTQLAPGSCG